MNKRPDTRSAFADVQAVNELALHWIDDDDDLAARAVEWSQASMLAVDTEFVRERTYFPLPGLIQVCDGRACYLIDPIAVTTLDPLAVVLGDVAVPKIMHACSEDLELFEHCLGMLPKPLFDTQVAAAFVGLGLSVGYQRLVEERAGISLEKSQTRTDWCQRPLSARQIHYAAEDVAYLPEIYRGLLQELETGGKLSWALAECETLGARRDPALRREQYRQLSGAWKLAPRQLASLRTLYRWREELARKRDLPRSWVAADRALLAMAAAAPTDSEALDRIDGLPKGTMRHHGGRLLSLLKDVAALDDAALPDPVPGPLSAGESRLAKRFKTVVKEIARQQNIAPELLARRRDIESLVQSCGHEDGQPLSALQGWRAELLRAPLQAALQESRS